MNNPSQSPAGSSPRYALASRVYRANLRPIVVILALLSGIWSLFWSIGLFKEINVDQDEHQPKLANFAIALGAIYMAAAVIEFFGVAAAGLQNMRLIRTYAVLSLISAVLVIGAAFVRVVTHFVLKNDLLSECQDLLTNHTVNFRWGLWGPRESRQLQPDEAERWCKNAWNHDSVSEIVSLLIEIVVMGLFTALAWAYYRQMFDPTSAANAARAPRSAGAAAAYNPAYNGSDPFIPDLAYDAPYNTYGAPYGQYPPPPGPPPNAAPPYHPDDEDDNKLPGYGVGADSSVGFDDVKKGDDPFTDTHSRA